MKYIFPIFALLLFSNPAYSSTYEKCITQFIDDSASKRLWLDARGLQRTCACIENKLAQNLKPTSCPNHDTIYDSEIRGRYR
tara:strand:+ start:124 stop:369 length:246 start_codon:yes stop_codon:yes gene_type:complete